MCYIAQKMVIMICVKIILGVIVNFPSVYGYLEGTSEIVYGDKKETNGYNLDPSWILYDAYRPEGIQQSSILQRPWKKSPNSFAETADFSPFLAEADEYSGRKNIEICRSSESYYLTMLFLIYSKFLSNDFFSLFRDWSNATIVWDCKLGACTWWYIGNKHYSFSILLFVLRSFCSVLYIVLFFL